MIYFFNDTHLGVQRVAGTTADSAAALQSYLLTKFDNHLSMLPDDCYVVHGGDLFDSFSVSNRTLTGALQVIYRHSQRGVKFFLMRGNHDVSKNGFVMSSFDTLCELLRIMGARVRPVTEPLVCTVEKSVLTLIPHLRNQDEFNAAWAGVPNCDYLFTHANYNNKFAEQADHSLNVSQEMAETCKARQIVFAHEHQSRTALGGKVIVVGNQTPSSVSDCLGNEMKRYGEISLAAGAADSGIHSVLNLVQCWEAAGSYAELDWHDLPDYMGPELFIRVVGKANSAESALMPKVLAQFRSRSAAFVVTNAVEVAVDCAEAQNAQLSLEALSAVDHRELLKSALTEAQWKHIQPALELHNVFARQAD